MEKITRQDYYVDAFKKINKEGKCTWNWSACLFSSHWLLYRKMYLYSFLQMLLSTLVTAGLLALIISGLGQTPPAKTAILASPILGIVYFIVSSVLYGFWGNNLYYRTVKKKIKRGYHLISRYRTTSLSLVILTSFMGILVFFCTPLYSFSDWISKKAHLRSKDIVNNEINETNIRDFLTSSNRDNNPSKCTKLFVSLVLAPTILFAVFFTLGVITKVAQKTQNPTQIEKSIEPSITKGS